MEAVIVALVTGAFAVIGEVIVSARNTKELYAKLDKQSEVTDERIKGELALVHHEIAELAKTVDKHNHVLERVYNLEKQMVQHEEQLKTLFNKG